RPLAHLIRQTYIVNRPINLSLPSGKLPRKTSMRRLSMNTNDHIISTENGRKIRITEAGQSDGIPVLVHNGTPGSRLLYAPWIKDAEARGIRLISYDRPGYGGSTPQPERTVASAADDVAAIADQLG